MKILVIYGFVQYYGVPHTLNLGTLILMFPTDEELLARLTNPEDTFVERKTNPNEGEIRKTLVAFANSVPETRTGVLYIGVTDEGNPVGVKGIDTLQRTIRKVAEQDCYPPISYMPLVLQKDEKQILAVVVGFNIERPHFAGPAWVRVGSESKRATGEQFEKLIASRNSKVREILKMKGFPITLSGFPYMQQGPTWTRQDNFDFEVKDCDQFFVTVNDYHVKKVFKFPLEKVRLSYDNSANRPKLVISET